MTTPAQKAIYDQKLRPIKASLETLKSEILKLKGELTKIASDDLIENYKIKYQIATKYLQEASFYIAVSRISSSYLNIKNENYLNFARKNFYNILQTFEEILGKHIDVGFEENMEHLIVLDEFTDNLKRFELFKRIGFLLNVLETLYGQSSKWKWSFIELDGRLVTVMKNAINFPVLFKNLDPSIPGYPERMDIINLITKVIDKAADGYRNKYEVKDKVMTDMRSALQLVAFRKRLAIIQNDGEMITQCKKKYDTWNKKLTADMAEEDKKTKEALRSNKI